MREEVGLELNVDQLRDVVLERQASFDFEGRRYEQAEHYFLVRVGDVVVETAGWSDVERRAICSYRWWSCEELAGSSETIYPEGLADLLAPLLPQEPPEGCRGGRSSTSISGGSTVVIGRINIRTALG